MNPEEVYAFDHGLRTTSKHIVGGQIISEQYPQEARVNIKAPHPAFPEAVAVGDLNSDAKGSGARKNAGKLEMDLVPVEFWYERWKQHPKWTTDLDIMLGAVDTWQVGMTENLYEWLTSNCANEYMVDAVKVLTFGKAKYKAWNWAKGMPWSVCLGCILRHTQKILDGEELDPESGISHWGHIVCNIIFLVYYADNYPEGDDRPPRYTK